MALPDERSNCLNKNCISGPCEEKFARSSFFRAEISYDGTDFLGWQSQPTFEHSHKISVQDLLEKTISRVFQCKAKTLGASRTDAGVHASRQVVLIRLDIMLGEKQFFDALNNSLPDSILLQKIQAVDKDFNPQKNVALKEYEYRLALKKQPPTIARFCWFYRLAHKIDLDRFFQALEIYSGSQKNFHQFFHKTVDNEKLPTTRDLEIAYSFDKELGVIKILFKSKGFLRYQIRRIVGACVQYSICDRFLLKNIEQSLQGNIIEQDKIPNFCASSTGLTLLQIVYENPNISFF